MWPTSGLASVLVRPTLSLTTAVPGAFGGSGGGGGGGSEGGGGGDGGGGDGGGGDGGGGDGGCGDGDGGEGGGGTGGGEGGGGDGARGGGGHGGGHGDGHGDGDLGRGSGGSLGGCGGGLGGTKQRTWKPQSSQSVPSSQSEYVLPTPPSSQVPSSAYSGAPKHSLLQRQLGGSDGGRGDDAGEGGSCPETAASSSPARRRVVGRISMASAVSVFSPPRIINIGCELCLLPHSLLATSSVVHRYKSLSVLCSVRRSFRYLAISQVTHDVHEDHVEFKYQIATDGHTYSYNT